MNSHSFLLTPDSAAYFERLHEDYRNDPRSVSAEWREFFESTHGNGRLREPVAAPPLLSEPIGEKRPAREPAGARSAAVLQDRVDQLLRAYRVRGHMIAQFDPLGRPRPPQPELDPAHYGLTDSDMDRQVSARTLAGPPVRTLRELLDRVRNTYCRSIGVQFMHIDDLEIRQWLQERMEGTENRLKLSRRQQFRILSRLTEAVVFEEFVQRKYVGAKTFSLEGSESLIPLLDLAIERSGEQGIDEIVIGMAHRGRLNVLANIMGKRPEDIFKEFEDDDSTDQTRAGDVKYHLGYSADWETAAGKNIHLSLCFNPSHLEFINPVAVGRMRAKQQRAGDAGRERGMVLLIHGDASFPGEGVVQETLNLSELPGYTVGGTLHVIVNNQIGFTTSPAEGRSSIYASGVARMLQIPIFMVNGEDPEAVAQVILLALDFRRLFKRDVVIDMYGYRRHGHNEMDEPTFTQPVLYHEVRRRKSVREGYLDHLLKDGEITREQAEELTNGFRQALEDGLALARSGEYTRQEVKTTGVWVGYYGGPERTDDETETGVDQKTLADFLRNSFAVPAGFHRHPKLERLAKAREEMADGAKPLDWAAAEWLALASLSTDGVYVRLSGQDSGRGTFSQRHAILYDFEDNTPHIPLRHLAANQAAVEIYNSPLSEAGVMGFEYGFSLDCPDGLVIWEAQYGDFFNAAQVIVDQFIISAEDKWGRLSGLVLMLPHGFEGQGPEHSSARIERFLTLAAEHNIQVVQPSTPAQVFHLLRRQVLRPWRKPLVIFTPKSLLRHHAVTSTLDELAVGTFRRVIEDEACEPSEVRRILLCSGKIYYELSAAREERGRFDVAIVRIEQYYPLRIEDLESALQFYIDGIPAFWVQEEPENMGAGRYLRGRLGDRLLGKFPLTVVARQESASPATGSSSIHKREQEELINQAMGG